jgi:hypothetical protein
VAHVHEFAWVALIDLFSGLIFIEPEVEISTEAVLD